MLFFDMSRYSLYVPASTMIWSPDLAALMASWMRWGTLTRRVAALASPRSKAEQRRAARTIVLVMIGLLSAGGKRKTDDSCQGPWCCAPPKPSNRALYTYMGTLSAPCIGKSCALILD